MANPYGLPENDPLLTSPGSIINMRDVNQNASNQKAQSDYALYMARLAREERLAQNAAGMGTQKLGALYPIANDPMQPKATRMAAQAMIDSQLRAGLTPEQIKEIDTTTQAETQAKEKANTEKPAGKGVMGEVGEFAQTTAGAALGGFFKLPGDLMTLAGSEDWGPRLHNFGEGIKQGITPDDVKVRAVQLQAMLDDDAVSSTEVGKFIGSNPDLMAYFGGEFLGGGGLAGGGVKLGVKALSKLGAAATIAKGIRAVPGLAKTTKAGAEATGIAGTMSLGEVGGIQNEVYNQVLAETGDPNIAAQSRDQVKLQPEVWAAAALGTIPIAEYALALRKIPALANLAIYKRIPAAALAEGTQEYGQETLQATGQAAATGDTGTFAERFADPNTQKQGVIGAVTGSVIGGIAGAPGSVGGITPNPSTTPPVVPPGTTLPAGTNTTAPVGTGAIASRAAANSTLANKIANFTKKMNTQVFASKDEAAQWLASKLASEPMLNTPELKADIDSFTKQIASGYVAPAPAGASNIPPATGAPAAAQTAPQAAPVAPIATSEQQATAANLTAATTGAAPPAADIAANVDALNTAQEAQTSAAKAAESIPDTASQAVAEVLLDGSSDTEVEDVLVREQKKAKAALGKIEATTETVRSNAEAIRKSVQGYAYRSAKIRGATDLIAEQYAQEMADYVVIPTRVGEGNLNQQIQDNFARADAVLGPKYRLISGQPNTPVNAGQGLIVPNTPQQAGSLANLGTQGTTDTSYNFNPSPIIDAEFRDITPLPQLEQGDRNLLGFDSRPDMQGTSVPGERPNPRVPKLPPRLTQQGRQGQELTVPGQTPQMPAPLQNGNISTVEGPNLDTPVDPILAAEFIRAIQENTPEAKQRAQEIWNQIQAFSPNTNPFDQEYAPTGPEELTQKETARPKRKAPNKKK